MFDTHVTRFAEGTNICEGDDPITYVVVDYSLDITCVKCCLTLNQLTFGIRRI